VLFKQLIGGGLLGAVVTGDAVEAEAVSLYAWCGGAPWWYSYSLVITYVNPTGADVDIEVAGGGGGTNTTRTEYMMTSSSAEFTASRARVEAGTRVTSAAPLTPPASLADDAVYLNGMLMTVDDSGVQPHQPLPGHVTDVSAPLVLPPYSYGFIVYSGPNPSAC